MRISAWRSMKVELQKHLSNCRQISETFVKLSSNFENICQIPRRDCFSKLVPAGNLTNVFKFEQFPAGTTSSPGGEFDKCFQISTTI